MTNRNKSNFKNLDEATGIIMALNGALISSMFWIQEIIDIYI